MAGIPLHITPLSYIRGNGSQYITTDIYLRSTDTVKSKWRFEGQAGNTYGCYTSGGADDNFCLYAGSQSVNAYIRYNGQVVREFKPPTGTIHELEQGPDGFFDNGVRLVSFSQATFTCSAPMYIFMLPNSSSAKVTARCYGLTVYRDGEQVCNFIPARNELTGEVGFWESVGGVFYENAGSGAFSAGPEANFSVKTLLLKRRRALLGAAKQSARRVRYIRGGADGSYIDTGITADNTVKVIVWARNVNPGAGFFFGSRDGLGNNMFELLISDNYTLSGSVRIDYAQTYNTFAYDIYDKLTGYHKYELYNGTLSIDDIPVTTSPTGTFSSNRTIHLFGNNNAGTHNNSRLPIDICACQIYKNNILVRDFTPVNSPNIGLYDAVSGEVFTKAGSGAFTYGTFATDAYKPLSYIVCNGSQYFDSGIKGSNTLDYVCRVTPNISTDFPCLFACQTSGSSKRYGVQFGNASIKGSCVYFLFNNASADNNTTITYNNSTFNLAKEGTTFCIANNGNTIYTGSVRAATFITDYNVYICGRNNAGTIGNLFEGKIHYLGLGSSRSFTPAKVNGVAGMYDTYNDIFYSSETSTPFIAGPEL